MAWGTAARNGFLSCHGGLKGLNCMAEETSLWRSLDCRVWEVHDYPRNTRSKYEITVLHDDAFRQSMKGTPLL